MLGEGQPTGPFVEGIYATDPYDGLPCDGPDPDLARQLLADGGYPDGFSMETIIITGESETNINLAQNLQAQLAEVGVDLELVQLETNVYVDRWLAADFDSALSENNSNPDPHSTYSRYFISGANFENVAGLTSPELDELFAEGLAETDPEARVPIYQEISRILLEESPWVWLYQGNRYQVLSPDVQGFVPHPTGSLSSLARGHAGLQLTQRGERQRRRPRRGRVRRRRWRRWRSSATAARSCCTRRSGRRASSPRRGR